jgi:hypothetical protein
MRQVSIIHRALRITQEDFAERDQISLGTLRVWTADARNPTLLPVHISGDRDRSAGYGGGTRV